MIFRNRVGENLNCRIGYNREMCYSARVKQHLKQLEKRYGAEIDWKTFEALFTTRLEDSSIKIVRALEANFDQPQTDVERRIKDQIEVFRAREEKNFQEDIFKQKKRLADAQRSLQVKETKKSREDIRIATGKIDKRLEQLTNLHRTRPSETDEQIFPMVYAPVIMEDGGKRWIRPMRYTCRQPGKPANYDFRYPGTYNARRDNLKGFWAGLYGQRHAIMIVSSFFENVSQHLYEKRELAVGEKGKNVILHFNPNPPQDMVIACLWAHWEGKDAPALDSFAAVTDDPPPEIAETGHNRIIISIRESNIDEWLRPEGVSEARLEQILSDREKPYYEHRIAA